MWCVDGLTDLFGRQLRENARIQFRLPDGTSFSNVFRSAQTLGEMRELVTDVSHR